MVVTIGVSLKMYLRPHESRAWLAAVAKIAKELHLSEPGPVELFVVPDFLTLAVAAETLAGTGVSIGAPDLFWEDRGAYTGEVSGADLAELGVRLVEVGHAERRLLFHEDDVVVARKTQAALRNGLRPVLCIGETEQGSRHGAAEACARQLDSALSGATPGRIVVAYEPVWAIGARTPAAPEHIQDVCAAVRETLSRHPHHVSTLIYGGSAKPGLLSTLGDSVDGVFLGRFAHDPLALRMVLEEAALK